MIEAILTLSGLGLVAGFGLGVASRVFAVYTDPKVEAVENALCEINGWRRRFSIYSELEPIFIGIWCICLGMCRS